MRFLGLKMISEKRRRDEGVESNLEERRELIDQLGEFGDNRASITSNMRKLAKQSLFYK